MRLPRRTCWWIALNAVGAVGNAMAFGAHLHWWFAVAAGINGGVALLAWHEARCDLRKRLLEIFE